MKKFRLSDGFILAAIPAAGFLIAYMYELGYCRYFNIPYDFIAIDRQITISSILAVLWLLTAFHPLIDFFRDNFSWVPKPIARVLLRNLLIVAILCGMSVVSRAKYAEMFIMCAIFVVPSVFNNIVVPLFSRDASSTFVDRVASQLSKRDAREQMFDLYARAAGDGVTWGVGLLFAVCLSAYLTGGYTAKSKIRFLTVRGAPEVVLIRSNSQFLVASYDSARRSISPDLRLVPLDVELRMADVGPLIPALPADAVFPKNLPAALVTPDIQPAH